MEAVSISTLKDLSVLPSTVALPLNLAKRPVRGSGLGPTWAQTNCIFVFCGPRVATPPWTGAESAAQLRLASTITMEAAVVDQTNRDFIAKFLIRFEFATCSPAPLSST